MSGRLTNRSALVTGSTNGIGSAIAVALAAEGAHVVVSGRDAESGEQVVKEIRAAGGAARFVEADLSSGAGVQQLAAGAGEVDLLVNNAALLVMPSATADVEEQLIDNAFAVNVKAAFLLTGLLAPAMVARGSGSIVNIGSMNGLFGSAQGALYSATKATIHSLTKSWSAEYGPYGVRVNTVAPGPTVTARVAGSELIQAAIAPMLAAMPSRLASTPEEVAAVVVFLSSDDASNIHGAALSVDGGRSAI
jgi:NAD(P)-dependent dehydrogenase (short-subunit alcohol dehydrogenase family)